MKNFLLVLVLLFCSSVSIAAEETEAPFLLPILDGWITETIPFPMGFAPELDYEGFEELRFAPGWRKPEREDFWTYAFVWWVPSSTTINAEILQRDLAAYYRGLASQSENPDIQAFVNAVGDSEDVFEGTINTIDTFATMEPITLNFRAEVIRCAAQNKMAVFFELSPQPKTHPVWVVLEEIRLGFRCGNKSEESRKTYRAGDAVRCGFLDSEGIIWFGTNNEGLFRFDGTSFINFTERDGLCSNGVTSIAEDGEGNLWFGTNDGLCRYDRMTFTHVSIPWDGNEDLWGKGMNANQVLSLIVDQKGILWFGTWGSGAYSYDGEKFVSFLADQGRIQDDGLPRNVIQSILEDQAGNIWFTSMTHGGVSRYDGENMTHFSVADGLSDDMIRSSFQDRDGNIWFGALGNRDGGLDRFDGESFTSFHESDGLGDNNVRCIYEDEAGRIWLGSEGGYMSIYDGKTFTAFTSGDGQTYSRIGFVMADAAGDIWFGGNYGKLFRYDGNIVTDFTHKGH